VNTRRAGAGTRLNKALADRGVASRRGADQLIVTGRVKVEGRVVRELATRVDEDVRIEVDGIEVRQVRRPRYLALNKPVGIVSSARAERGRRSVVDLIGAPERLYPVGRLDVDSEGLILLTNDGDWAERVMHPRYGHEREYDVRVTGPLSTDVLARLRRGVRLDEGLARAADVSVTARRGDSGRLRIVLRTGWKRQVRRMCAAVGLRVVALRRVRIGPLSIGRLGVGEWRELSAREVSVLAGEVARGAA
jgi:23S rRNA pseudouridine2605 synthase